MKISGLLVEDASSGTLDSTCPNDILGLLVKKLDEGTNKRITQGSNGGTVHNVTAMHTGVHAVSTKDECSMDTTPMEQLRLCQPLAYLFAFLLLDMIWEVMFGLAFDQLDIKEAN